MLTFTWAFHILLFGTLRRSLEQGLSGSGVGGAMTLARFQLAPVLIVVAMWSLDLVVIYVTSGALCSAMRYFK